MFKVEKNSLQELVVNFKEFFVGATIEEATKKAHEQEKPKQYGQRSIKKCDNADTYTHQTQPTKTIV